MNSMGQEFANLVDHMDLSVKLDTEQKVSRSEILKAQYFDTLSKKEQWLTTDNNRAKIWIDQMEGLLNSNRELFRLVGL